MKVERKGFWRGVSAVLTKLAKPHLLTYKFRNSLNVVTGDFLLC